MPPGGHCLQRSGHRVVRRCGAQAAVVLELGCAWSGLRWKSGWRGCHSWRGWHRHNPGARLLDGDEALLALVGSEAVFGPGTAGATAGRRDAAAGQAPIARHGDFVTVALRSDRRFDADLLEDFVTDLPDEAFRAKGIACVDGAAGSSGGGRWLAFQAVGARTRVELPATAPAHHQSRLAFFGRGLDRAALEARLRDCELEPAPLD